MKKGIHHVHLVGICGMGMGAFAGLLKEAGFEITGSDADIYPPMSTQLESEGIKVYKGYKAENLLSTIPPHLSSFPSRDYVTTPPPLPAPSEVEGMGGACLPAGRDRGGGETVDFAHPPLSPLPSREGKNVMATQSPRGEEKKEGATGRPDLVIIGNVITKDNPEAEAVLKEGIPYLSMPEALSKFFLEGRHSIVVAGTHGKTTTAILVAWLLERAGLRPSFLIGGIAKNFGKSFKLSDGKYFVIEGDEYDTAFFDKGPKFLHYRPRSVILGTVEFDHADIYRDLNHVLSSFERLIKIIPPDGLLIASSDSENTKNLIEDANCKIKTFGLRNSADYMPKNIKVTANGTSFELCKIQFHSPMFGEHNLQNIVAALSLGIELKIDTKKLQEGLSSFEGVTRRQEVKAVINDIVIIDDFAHHPTAVSGAIKAVREQFPGQRVFAIFEPRSNTSRRNIFQNELRDALETADISIISAVNHPEKIPKEERLDPEKLVGELKARGGDAHYIETADDIVKFIAAHANKRDVILIMSNGSFDNIHTKIIERLKR